MSVIVIAAYEEMQPTITWREFHFSGRIIPSSIAPSLQAAFRRWSDHVQPIYSGGHIVGLWVSTLMTDRKWRRLRAVAEHLLVQDSAEGACAPNDEAKPDVYILSLSKHGLHIPAHTVERTREALSQLGDIAVECDDDYHGVKLLIPRGTSLAGVLRALEVDAEPIGPVSPSARRQLFESLRDEIRGIEPSVRSSAK